MDEGQRERLRRLVAELTGGGQDLAGLPGHKTGMVERLCELGRYDEAVRIENGGSLARIKFLCFGVLSHIGIVTTKVEMDAPSLYRNEFYGDWNYELRP